MPDTISWKTASLLLALAVAGPGYEQYAAGQSTPSGEREANRKNTGQSKGRRPSRQGLSPGQVLVQRFDRTAPQIGDLLPDVAGFDADGNKLQLRSLQGHHSVLIFGCLT